MIDVSDAFKEAWLNGKQKHIQLAFSDGTAIMDDDIVAESFSLTQALCDEPQLVFGLTSSAEFRIQLFNTGKQFKGLYVTPTLYVNVDETQYSLAIGSYLIDEDTRSDDRLYRTLTGHDALYNVLNEDYSVWYKTLSAMTIKEFRDAFFTHVGITQEFEVLANDNLTINIKPEVSSLSGAEIIKCICEPNACFGFINYAGHFQYVQPSVGGRHFPADDLYPSNDLYPGDGANIIMDMSDAESAPVMGGLVYSDYYTHKITQAKFVYSENTPEVIGGVAGNCYQFEDNILMYGQSASALSTIVTNFLRATDGFFYTPSRVKGRARIWAELGDMLGVDGGYDSVRFPVLRRYMSGITALYDEYSAQGTEFYTYSANSVYQRLTDVETGVSENSDDIGEINDEIEDIEEDVGNLQISLRRTEEGLAAEVSRATGAESGLSSRITITENGISSEVTNRTNADTYLQSAINQSAHSISMSVNGRASKNTSAGITITLKDANNNTLDTETGYVYIDGDVIFSSQLTDGTTRISGNNIQTGTIDASRVTVTNLSASSIDTSYFHVDRYLRLNRTDQYGSNYLYLSCDSFDNLYVSTTSSLSGNADIFCGDVTCDVLNATKSYPGKIYSPETANDTTSSAANGFVNSSTGHFGRSTASSQRYKHDITTDISEELDPHKLYDLPVKQYIYNTDYLNDVLDKRYNKPVIGFIAEDVDKIYNVASDIDSGGFVDDWNFRFLLPPMLKLIQEQHEKIKELEERISVLEGGN